MRSPDRYGATAATFRWAGAALVLVALGTRLRGRASHRPGRQGGAAPRPLHEGGRRWPATRRAS